MSAVQRLVRHFLLRKQHVPRHAKPTPLSPPHADVEDDLIPFASYRHPYSPKDAA